MEEILCYYCSQPILLNDPVVGHDEYIWHAGSCAEAADAACMEHNESYNEE